MSNVWSLLSLEPEDRQFSGNEGYDDVLGVHYSYDTTVPNHKGVDEGDLALVRDGAFALGIGWIEKIGPEEDVTKIRRRCPKCGYTDFKHRKHLRPTFRCSRTACLHVFEHPVEENVLVRKFTAYYGTTWEPLDGLLSAKELEPIYKKRAAEHAIRELDLALLQAALTSKAFRVRDDWWDAEDELRREVRGGMRWTSGWGRIGQDAFRSEMLTRFGSRCAISGPQPLAVLEAAHLYRYAQLTRHHLDGGLLLRRDLHALMDRGHRTIHPKSWSIELSPELREYEHYAHLAGCTLALPTSLYPRVKFITAHYNWATAQWVE